MHFIFALVQRLNPAAEPGGNIIEAVTVQSLGPSVWSIALTPASCGTGIDLLQIADATVVSGNTASNQAIFRPINASENSNIVVTRDHAATPPVGGTFDIILENEKVKGNCVPVLGSIYLRTSRIMRVPVDNSFYSRVLALMSTSG